MISVKFPLSFQCAKSTAKVLTAVNTNYNNGRITSITGTQFGALHPIQHPNNLQSSVGLEGKSFGERE
jgi:hypothetical protein